MLHLLNKICVVMNVTLVPQVVRLTSDIIPNIII